MDEYTKIIVEQILRQEFFHIYSYNSFGYVRADFFFFGQKWLTLLRT